MDKNSCLKLTLGKEVDFDSFQCTQIELYKIENNKEVFLGKVNAPIDPIIQIVYGGEDRFYISTNYVTFTIIYNQDFKGLYRFDSVCTKEMERIKKNERI